MSAVDITAADLAPFAIIDEEKSAAMIAAAMARAALIAPCITSADLPDEKADAAKAIICDAILRWNDAGSGALSSQTAGPFGQAFDTRQFRRSLFSQSEKDELRALCRTTAGRAYELDLTPPGAGVPQDCGPWGPW